MNVSFEYMICIRKSKLSYIKPHFISCFMSWYLSNEKWLAFLVLQKFKYFEGNNIDSITVTIFHMYYAYILLVYEYKYKSFIFSLHIKMADSKSNKKDKESSEKRAKPRVQDCL